MTKIETFIAFLTNKGFVPNGICTYTKFFTGAKSNRPMSKTYVIDGKRITRKYRYEDTSDKTKDKDKTFSVDRVEYVGDKFRVAPTFAAMKNQAMRDLGLTMVRGPVSGKVYWE